MLNSTTINILSVHVWESACFIKQVLRFLLCTLVTLWGIFKLSSLWMQVQLLVHLPTLGKELVLSFWIMCSVLVMSIGLWTVLAMELVFTIVHTLKMLESLVWVSVFLHHVAHNLLFFTHREHVNGTWFCLICMHMPAFLISNKKMHDSPTPLAPLLSAFYVVLQNGFDRCCSLLFTPSTQHLFISVFDHFTDTVLENKCWLSVHGNYWYSYCTSACFHLLLKVACKRQVHGMQAIYNTDFCLAKFQASVVHTWT